LGSDSTREHDGERPTSSVEYRGRNGGPDSPWWQEDRTLGSDSTREHDGERPLWPKAARGHGPVRTPSSQNPVVLRTERPGHASQPIPQHGGEASPRSGVPGVCPVGDLVANRRAPRGYIAGFPPQNGTGATLKEPPMIVTAEQRKEQADRRLELRCSAAFFANVVVAGTNCSPFGVRRSVFPSPAVSGRPKPLHSCTHLPDDLK
jgi:hypothetical protein